MLNTSFSCSDMRSMHVDVLSQCCCILSKLTARTCRQKIAKDPEWLATAEAHRQEVLERLVTSAKPAVPVRMVQRRARAARRCHTRSLNLWNLGGTLSLRRAS